MFSDQDLRTYLAGEAEDAAASRIEAALGSDPDLERRLMALDAVAEPVRAAFVTLPDPARLTGLDAAISASGACAAGDGGATPWRRIAAGVAVGLALGAGGALLGTGGAEPSRDWRGMVAVYQALYTEETIAPITVDRAALETQLAQAEAALGSPIPRAALGAPDGLTLLRAQVLGLDGRAIVQIVYRDAAGAPIALCLTRNRDGDGASTLSSGVREGLASAAWSDESHAFILIGGEDVARIHGLAATVRARWS